MCMQGHGGNSRCTEAATARSMAMAYSSLSKVLQALRHSAPATALEPGPTGAAAAALAAGIQNSMHQLQHVPWRDSPLTRWLQERLHAARRIALLGTVTTLIEVRSMLKLGHVLQREMGQVACSKLSACEQQWHQNLPAASCLTEITTHDDRRCATHVKPAVSCRMLLTPLPPSAGSVAFPQPLILVMVVYWLASPGM